MMKGDTITNETRCTCPCGSADILLFPCSGGSNVGQMANDAARDLTMQGKGRMYCLAGIGGHVNGIIESTRAASKLVAIDGCPVQCARKALEHAGFPVDVHVVVTDLGLKKDHGFTYDQQISGRSRTQSPPGYYAIQCSTIQFSSV